VLGAGHHSDDSDQASSYTPIVSVSRRFNDSYVDDLYHDIVRPALEWAKVLECHYASEDTEASDYWINRMGVIQDISDIHLILDLRRSGPTLYEFHYSNLSCSEGFRDFLALNFDCHPMFNHRKVRIIVHDEVHYHPCSPSYSIRPLRIGSTYPRTRGTDIVVHFDAGDIPLFKREFGDAMARAVLAESQQRAFLWELARKPLYRKFMFAQVDAPTLAGLLLSPSVYYRFCMAVAERIEEGALIDDIISEINAASMDDGPRKALSAPADRDRKLLSLDEALAAGKPDAITAYNRLLAELVTVSRQVLDDPSGYDQCYRFALIAGVLSMTRPSQLQGHFATTIANQIARGEAGSNWAFSLITRLQAHYVRHVMTHTVKR
jgi:hypothetical protein